MSRSGYSEDCEGTDLYLYRGRVASATRGKRGQSFFRDLLAAMDTMPERRLIANELEAPTGAVCAIGALGKARGVDMSALDPEDADSVSKTFNIAECLACEVVYMNDEEGIGFHKEGVCTDCHGWGEAIKNYGWGFESRPTKCQRCQGIGRRRHYIRETAEQRWVRMRAWVASQIKATAL